MLYVVILVLTVTAHAHGDAFLQATILTAVAIDAQNAALLVLGARTILDLLLDGAPEEALRVGRNQERRDCGLIHNTKLHIF